MEAGDARAARLLLVEHLRMRASPRFFIQPEELAGALCKVIEQRPDAATGACDWRQHIWCAKTAGAPTEMPEWNALPHGPGQDQLYQDRAHMFSFALHLARAHAYRDVMMNPHTGLGIAGAVGPARLPCEAPPERRDASLLPLLGDLLRCWIEATTNVPDAGAYSSPLIAVYRAVALTWTWLFLAGSPSRDMDLEFDLLRILLADGRYVHAGLGSSYPNNHLLADGFLCWYLGVLLPEFSEAERWRHDGEALFLKELRRQVYADGGSFEHSVHYHEMVCEMVAAYVLLRIRNGHPPPEWVSEKAQAMLRLQAVLAGPEGVPPAVGDCFELSLFPLDGTDGTDGVAHRELLRALFEPDFPRSRAVASGWERAFWLLGGELGAASKSAAPVSFSSFPEAGFYTFAERTGETRLIFRTGPHPESHVAPGHMHADLLSVFLHIECVPVIVDAGTYTYRSDPARWPAGEPRWRAHFLGPGAHNGLALENLDPLRRRSGDFPGGPIRSWTTTRITSASDRLRWVEAGIVGSTEYAGHHRGVVHVPGRYWLVYDIPPADLPVQAWYGFQFAAGAIVRISTSASIDVRIRGVGVTIATDGLGQPYVVTGMTAPPSGWVSERYGDLQPAPQLRLPLRSGAALSAVALIPGDAGIDKLEARTVGRDGLAFRLLQQDREEVVLLSRAGEETTIECWGIGYRGTGMWISRAGTGALEIRLLRPRELSIPSLGFRQVFPGNRD